MVTIFDVAKKAQVSVVTVSRLMNNPQIVSSRTSRKIFQAMEELNYQPSQAARSLVKKTTNTIGVIMPDIKNTFFNSWFRFIEEYAAEYDFNLLLCNTDEETLREIKYIKLLQSQRVDGVIIAATSEDSIQYLLKSKMRFILFDRVFNIQDSNYVTTDHYQGAFDGTEYLIKLGHKAICVFRGPGILYPDIERYNGFQDAMKKYDLYVDNDLVLNCEFNDELAYEAALRLFQSNNRPTAIFPFNSLMSKGVIRAAQDLNLTIPDDLSLIGYDEIPGYDIFRPRITHVIQPIDALGKEIILAMINMIKNKEFTNGTQVCLKPKIVIGDSCKKNNGYNN